MRSLLQGAATERGVEWTVADREQIRESSLLWVDLENFSKVTLEGNILDGRRECLKAWRRD